MRPRPDIALRTVNLDCHDAQAMARFYSALLGWEPTFTEPDWVLMRSPEERGVGLSFQADPAYAPPVYPERPGEQQKMIHLDVRVVPADGQAPHDALVAALSLAEEAGGRAADQQPRDDLRIVLDPAGHPLCLFLD